MSAFSENLLQEFSSLLRQLALFLKHHSERTLLREYQSLSETEKTTLRKFIEILKPEETAGKADEIAGEPDEADGPDSSAGESRRKLFDTTAIAPGDYLNHWIADYATFFDSISTDLVQHSWATAYKKIRMNETVSEILTIRRRFQLRNLYLSVVNANYHTGKSWRHDGSLQLATNIKNEDSSIAETVEDIKKTLEIRIELGIGYNYWVSELGEPGYLILMPSNVSETEYAGRHYRRRIPEGARHLDKLGIKKLATDSGVLPLGRYISENLLSMLSLCESYKVSKRKAGDRQSDHSSQKRRGQPYLSSRTVQNDFESRQPDRNGTGTNEQVPSVSLQALATAAVGGQPAANRSARSSNDRGIVNSSRSSTSVRDFQNLDESFFQLPASFTSNMQPANYSPINLVPAPADSRLSPDRSQQVYPPRANAPSSGFTPYADVHGLFREEIDLRSSVSSGPHQVQAPHVNVDGLQSNIPFTSGSTSPYAGMYGLLRGGFQLQSNGSSDFQQIHAPNVNVHGFQPDISSSRPCADVHGLFQR